MKDLADRRAHHVPAHEHTPPSSETACSRLSAALSHTFVRRCRSKPNRVSSAATAIQRITRKPFAAEVSVKIRLTHNAPVRAHITQI